MKNFALHFLAISFSMIFLHSSLLLGAEFEFRSETIARSLERGATDDESKFFLPVYEYLGLDYGAAESGGFSLHLHGWIRKDMTDTGYYQDDPDGELLYGFLQYAKPYSRLRVHLGRQHIFSGITNESLDGLNVETGLGPYFSASIFGGMPVAYETEDTSNGYITYGGRLAHHLGPDYEIGISYQNTTPDGEATEEKVGADLVIQIGSWLILNGLSSYNLETRDWREYNINASLQIGRFALEPSYHYFQYNDYFNTDNPNNNVFNFLKDSDETLAIAGADVLWQPAGPVEIGVRGRNYTYHVRNESAQYYAGLLTFNLPAGSQIGAEAGRMEGETANNTYNLYRGYFYWQNPFKLSAAGFISGDAMVVSYDTPVYGVDSSTHYALGAGHTFYDNRLEAKLSVTYSQDPYFDSDVGGLMTILFQL